MVPCFSLKTIFELEVFGWEQSLPFMTSQRDDLFRAHFQKNLAKFWPTCDWGAGPFSLLTGLWLITIRGHRLSATWALQVIWFFAWLQSISRKYDAELLNLEEQEDLAHVGDICWRGVTPAPCFPCTDFGLPDTFLSTAKSAEVSVHADIHLQPPGQKHAAAHKAGTVMRVDGLWLGAVRSILTC